MATLARAGNGVVILGGQPLGRLLDLKIMPSLFRFLVLAGLIGGIGYVAVFSLATFVKFQPREISVTIPPDKFLKQPH